jgi:CubicO group peptidase (beta-lactamase class C family)
MKQLSLYTFVFILFFSLPGTILSQQNNTRIDSLFKAVQGIGVFNGNVLVVYKGKVIYRQSLGYADGSKTKLLEPAMLFDIGSISKEFNGVGILLLQQQAKLSLDDKLSRHITGLPAWSDSIQLKHLINYTSGLPGTAANSDVQILSELKNLAQLAAAPGKIYNYSYSNVYLQRLIIEKIAGMSYAAFTEKYLLKPAGMKNSIVDLPVTSSSMARAFDNNFKETVYAQDMKGWVRTNADDLYQWLVQLDNNKIVNKASMQALAVHFDDGESSLGDVRFEEDKLVWHQHHGSNYNYEALMTDDVKNEIVIVLMTNNQQFKVKAITNAIIAIIKGEAYIVPKKSLYLDLREKVLDDFNKGMAFYRDVKVNQQDKYDLSFEIADLVNTGKYLMRRQRYDDAISLFLFGTTLPVAASDYSYAYQLTAECYLKKGYRDMAILYLQKAIEKDPANANAKGMLNELLK